MTAQNGTYRVRRWVPSWVPNCGHCGRFVSLRQADWYAPWGGYHDVEPPDERFLCPSCADEVFQRTLKGALERGICAYEHRSAWQPSDAWRRARAVARAMWKHGHPRPERHERVRHETEGRGDTFRVQEWCACGWTTGMLPSRPDRQVDYLGAGTLIREHMREARIALGQQVEHDYLFAVA